MSEASEAETRRRLRYAAEDVQAARHSAEATEFAPRHACWLAQQSAEKALKAAFVFLQTDFPFTHDLDRLRNLIPEEGATRTFRPGFAFRMGGRGTVPGEQARRHAARSPECCAASGGSPRDDARRSEQPRIGDEVAAAVRCGQDVPLGQITRALFEVGGQYRRNM